MKNCLILMGRYGGQLLRLDDSTAAIAIADGWAWDVAGKSQPYESVPFLVAGPRLPSLRAFEVHIGVGGLGTDVIQPSPILSITAANPAVVTVDAAQSPKFTSATRVEIEGTGNDRLDGKVFNCTVGGSPVGSVITLTGFNNIPGPAVSNQGTITATTTTTMVPADAEQEEVQ